MKKKTTSAQRKKKRRGFTLTEVMVALSIISIMTPAILSTYLFFNRLIIEGIRRNQNLADARRFEQFFIQKINSTQRSTLGIDGPGYQLTFLVPVAGGTWTNASIVYRPARHDFVYTEAGHSKTILTNAFPFEGTTRIFSKISNLVTCRVRVGVKEKERVELRCSASTRN